MKKYNILSKAIICITAFGTLTITSCNYLDVVPPEQADTKDMMINDATTLQNLYSCYGYIQHGGADLPEYMTIDNGGSDETVRPQEWQGMGSRTQWNAITPSSINNDSNYPWVIWYNAIGYCNQFLSLIQNEKLNLNPNDKAQYIGEVNFLKAYYHFRALELYGPIPIIDKQSNSNISKTDIPGRSHFDYCVSYIDSLLTAAEPSLPESYDNASYYGRATSIICKALRAKLYLLAASPLWNGDFPDKTWKNTNYETPGYGLELVSHEYDANKWVKAREACVVAIKAAEAAGHALFTVDDAESLRKNQNVALPVVPNVTDENFLKRVMMMRYMMCARPDQGNKEIIWGMAPTGDVFTHAYFGGSLPHYILINNNGVRVGGWGGVSPTLYTVQHFYTKNGLLPEEDTNFAHKADWYKSAGLGNSDIINLNVNREPRFYAWISFDGDQYSTELANRTPVYCEMRNNEHSGYDAEIWGTRNYSVTGYLNKKWVHPNFDFNGNGWNANYDECRYPLSMIRLGELYLDLAECDAHLGDQYQAEALSYLNKIRSRAGVPDVTTDMLTKSSRSLIQIVLDERFIEMYTEGTRYYDIRRYVQGKKYQSAECYMGLNAMKKSPSFADFNTPTKINQSFGWEDRMYLMPISNSEVYANPQMVQAPGY